MKKLIYITSLFLLMGYVGLNGVMGQCSNPIVPAQVCINQTAPTFDLTTLGPLTWYSALTPGNAPTAQVVSTQIPPGTYYTPCAPGGQSGPNNYATMTIVKKPLGPMTPAATYCASATGANAPCSPPGPVFGYFDLASIPGVDNWYFDFFLINPVIASCLAVPHGGQVTVFATVDGSTNGTGCESEPSQVTIYGAEPPAIGGISPICENALLGTVNIDLLKFTYFPFIQQWYADAGLTTPVGGHVSATDYDGDGIYYGVYFGTCTSIPVELEILEAPDAPVLTATSVCTDINIGNNDPLDDLFDLCDITATNPLGAPLTWYSSLLNVGFGLDLGTCPTPGGIEVGVGTYYATYTDPVTGCESRPTQVDVYQTPPRLCAFNVGADPGPAPTCFDVTASGKPLIRTLFCRAANAPSAADVENIVKQNPSYVGFATLTWYEAAAGVNTVGAVIGDAAAFQAKITADYIVAEGLAGPGDAITLNYNVTQTLTHLPSGTACESRPSHVRIVIRPLPDIDPDPNNIVGSFTSTLGVLTLGDPPNVDETGSSDGVTGNFNPIVLADICANPNQPVELLVGRVYDQNNIADLWEVFDADPSSPGANLLFSTPDAGGPVNPPANSFTVSQSVPGVYNYWVRASNEFDIDPDCASTRIIRFTILPEPVGAILSIASTPTCSDVSAVVTLGEDPSSPVAVNNYLLNSFTAQGGLVYNEPPSSAVLPNPPFFANTPGDRINLGNSALTLNFTNISPSAKTATLNVTPVSADGCEGASFDIVLTVNPEPVIAAAPSPLTVCSGVPLGVTPATLAPVQNGLAGVKYCWPVPAPSLLPLVTATQAVSAAASAGVAPNGLQLLLELVDLAASDRNCPGSNATINHTWYNMTGLPGTVTYTMTAYSADNCEGNTVAVTVVVLPEPTFINPTLVGATATNPLPEIVTEICSGETTNICLPDAQNGIILQAFPNGGVPFCELFWAAPDLTNGLLANPPACPNSPAPNTWSTTGVAESHVLPGNVADCYVNIQDTYTNLTGRNQTATYEIFGVSCSSTGACTTNIPLRVRVIVHPKPELVDQVPNPFLLCSSDPTVDLNASTVIPREGNRPSGNGTGGGTYTGCINGTGEWFRKNNNDLNYGPVAVTGVQTVSNGDMFRYIFTSTDGCKDTAEYTVSLQESPVIAAVNNPVLCPDPATGAASLDLDLFTPGSVTISAVPADPDAGEWYRGTQIIPANLVTKSSAALGGAGADANNYAPFAVQDGDQFTYVFVNGSNLCAESVTIDVSVPSLPTAILTGGGSICPPALATSPVTVNLTGTGPWTFIWTLNGVPQPAVTTASNAYVIPNSGSTVGTYQVTSITDNGTNSQNNGTQVNGPACTNTLLSNSVQVVQNALVALCVGQATVTLDPTFCQAVVTSTVTNAGSYFGCPGSPTGDLQFTLSKTIFTCADIGPQIVTMTVYHVPTMTTQTCQSTLIVQDITPPVLSNLVGPVVVVAANVAAVGSPVACTAVNPSPSECEYNTNTGQAWVPAANDACTLPPAPAPACPARLLTWSVTYTQVNCVGGSPIGTPTTVSSPAGVRPNLNGKVFEKGCTLVEWVVSDPSGNTSAHAYVVEVQDQTAPTIVCPTTPIDILTSSVTTLPDDCKALALDLRCNFVDGNPANGEAADNCILDVTHITQSRLPGSDIVGCHNDLAAMTVTVEDCGGVTASCTLQFRIVDDEVPTIACPADIVIQCDESTLPANTGSVVAVANKAGLPLSAGEATDNCAGGSCPALNITYTDVSTKNPNVNTCGHYNYTITRTWRATDAAGNTATCNQIITVEDTEAPVFAGNASVGVPTLPAGCDVEVAEAPNYYFVVTGTFCTICDLPRYGLSDLATLGITLTDNCSPMTNPLTLPSEFGLWTQTRCAGSCPQTIVETYVARDLCGNTSYIHFVFTQDDVVTPIISDPADVTLNCQDVNAAVFAAVDGPSGACIPAGLNSDWIAAGTQPNVGPSTGRPSVTENCAYKLSFADVSTKSANPAVCAFYTYTITRTWLIEDVCSNNATQTQLINVQDVTAPTISCSSSLLPAGTATNYEIVTDPGTCAYVLASGVITATVSDNCASAANITTTWTITQGATVIASGNGLSALGTLCPGDYTITFSTKDPCNNAASCSKTLRVKDVTAPTALCKNVTVYLNASGQASITPADVDNGSFDNCGPTGTPVNCTGALQYSLSRTNFTCADLGPTVNGVCSNGSKTVVLTVTDPSGNTATCSATVTIIDDRAPIMVCQNVTVFLDGFCAASMVPNDGIASLSDNCAVTSLTGVKATNVLPGTTPTFIKFDGTDLTTPANPPITVTLTAKDCSGNTTTCTIAVTVRDIINPAITCPGNITVNAPAANCNAYVIVPVPSMADNCLVTTTVNDFNGLPQAFGNFCVGTTPVTFTTYDHAGNSASCTMTVTVLDVTPPTPVCKPSNTVIVQLDATGNASITGALLDNGSTDNCKTPAGSNSNGVACGGSLSFSASKSTFNCTNVGQNVVTLTVTDPSGNTATCNTTIIVVDNVPPVAICQNITLDLAANGSGTITAAQVNNGSNDACGIGSLVLSKTSFNCGNVGNNTVVLTVTDVNGNTATCSANVLVRDVTNPVALCKPFDLVLGFSGTATLNPLSVDNGSTDACGIVQRAVNPANFDCSNLNLANNGVNTTVLTVTDPSGNTASCTATIRVVDQTEPTVVCKGNVVVLLNALGNGTLGVTDIEQSSSDNCTIVSKVVSKTAFNCSDVGTQTVLLTVTDQSGNVGICGSLVTIRDLVAPNAVCAQPFSINLTTTAPGSATITVAQINNGSSDACGILSTTISKSSFSCADLGANVITLTVTDVNGNVSTCTTTVTVLDVTNPTITTTNVDLCNTTGACSAPVTVSASASDNCTIVTQSYSGTYTPAGYTGISPYPFNGTGLSVSATFPVGTGSVTFTVIDQSGNSSSATATIIVRDCEAPVINPVTPCPGSVTLNNVTNDCYQSYAWIEPTATDNCVTPTRVRTLSNPSVFVNVIQGTAFALFPVGVTTVTYTFNDQSPDSSPTVCTFTVTVNDNQPPVLLNCPNGTTINANATANLCGTNVALPNVQPDDNCNIVSFTSTAPANGFFPVGTNTVNYTATDASGNTASCNFTVIVTDNQAPSITCPAVITVNNTAGQCGANVTWPAPVRTDNCGIATTTGSPMNGSFFNVGTTPVTITTTDVNGNSASCTFTVTVRDTQAPSITCPANRVVAATTGNCSAPVTWTGLSATDNCGLVAGSPTTSAANGSVFPVGVTTVTATALDVNGNSTTCTFTVTVQDTQNPTVTCPAPINVALSQASGANCFTTVSYNVTAADNCPGVTTSLVSGLPSGGSFIVGSHTVVWRATDASGNSATCSFTVTVTDGQAPTIVGCPPTPPTPPAVLTVNANPGATAVAPGVGVTPVVLSNNGAGAALFSGSRDDGYWQIPMPFAMNYFGSAIAANAPLNIVTNGYVTFGTPATTTYVMPAIPNAATPNNFIAGVWTDMDFASFGTLRYFVNGTAPNRSLVVEYTDVPRFGSTPPATGFSFQIILNESGATQAEIRTLAVNNGTSLNNLGQGFENAAGTAGFTTQPLAAVWTVPVTTASLLNFQPQAPAAFTFNADPGLCGTQVVFPTIYAQDNCNVQSFTSNAPANNFFPVGRRSVTFIASDGANTASCTFDVEVFDNQAPSLTCPSDITVANDRGDCGAVVNFDAPLLDDNCNGFAGAFAPINWNFANNGGDGSVDAFNAPDFIAITSSNNGQGFNPTGTTPNGTNGDANLSITIPATGNIVFDYLYGTDDGSAFFDPFGYTINGVFTAVEDGNSVTNASGQVVVPVTAGQTFGLVMKSRDGLFGRATAVISNFGLNIIATQVGGLASGSQFPVGTSTIVYQGSDLAGNSASCSFTVTVLDTEAPAFAGTPQSLAYTGSIGGIGSSAQTSGCFEFTANVVDNQTITDVNVVNLIGTHTWLDDMDVVLISPSGTTVRLFNDIGTSSDNFNVNLNDQASGPIPTTGYPGGTGTNHPMNIGATYQPTGILANVAGTTCPTARGPLQSNLAAFNGQLSGGVWKLQIIDDAGGDFGNLQSWAVEITSIVPLGPTNATLPNDPGQCGAVYTYTPPAFTDNCGTPTVSQRSGLPSGSLFPVGTTTNTFEAVDAAGNSVSYSWDVTVEDLEAPTISCPADITAATNATDCFANVPYTVTANDNCPGVTTALTAGLPSLAAFPSGTTTVTWLATDAAGLTASCSFTVTVVDQTNPIVTGCPADIVVSTDPGRCDAQVTWNESLIVTSDNCPGESLTKTHDPSQILIFPKGVTTVAYIATDAAGNTGSCSFTITVNDTEFPVLTSCPSSSTWVQDPVNCCVPVGWAAPTATDNCPNLTITQVSGLGSGACYPIGITTNTFVISDEAGNSLTCSFTIEVTELFQTAVISTPSNQLLCANGAFFVVSANAADPGFTAQWGVVPPAGVVFDNISDATTGVTFPGPGTYTLCWTIRNRCTQTFSVDCITVIVNENPSVVATGNDPSLYGAQDGDATAYANGGTPPYSYLWSAGGQSTANAVGLGAGTYTVTVTDSEGCTGTASVTLNDPALYRICDLKDYQQGLGAFGMYFFNLPGGSEYDWSFGNGTFLEYVNGEVNIQGQIENELDANKKWLVNLWLVDPLFWGQWQALGGSWLGNPAIVGSNYQSWTYHLLDPVRSSITAPAGSFFAGYEMNVSHMFGGGPYRFQIGLAANDKDADFGMSGWFTYEMRNGPFILASGQGDINSDFNNCQGPLRLRPMAILEGSYDTQSGRMSDNLRANGLVPTTEPYTSLGYQYVNGGGETINPSILTTTGNDAVVDWVIVELRDANNPTVVVGSRAALLQADGDIVDTDNSSTLTFNGLQDGNYYVAVIHRNHLGVMSGNAIALTYQSTTTVDFTNPVTPIFGSNAQKLLVNGKCALFGGDADNNGQVQNTDDVNQWIPQVGTAGYRQADYNLDGQVQNTDRVFFWTPNSGRGTQIPK